MSDILSVDDVFNMLDQQGQADCMGRLLHGQKPSRALYPVSRPAG